MKNRNESLLVGWWWLGGIHLYKMELYKQQVDCVVGNETFLCICHGISTV